MKGVYKLLGLIYRYGGFDAYDIPGLRAADMRKGPDKPGSNRRYEIYL